jgi:cytochrome c peroxidase
MRSTVFGIALFGCIGTLGCGVGDVEEPLEHRAAELSGGRSDGLEKALLAELGRQLFFDERLSAGGNQACAACHGPKVGWTGPDREVNLHGAVYEGSIAGRFGNRKPPSSAYASLAPIFDYDRDALTFVGGNFWDGRATGWKLGNPAADQAQGPFLNPVEQGLPDAEAVVKLVCDGSYGHLFRKVWGRSACRHVDRAYDAVARSIAAYEGSPAVSRFSSRFDAFLAGRRHLTPEERLGYQLFNGKARCSNCHVSARGDGGAPPPFTDFTYDNLGVPRNPENPFYRMDTVFVDGKAVNPDGASYVDRGLGGFLDQLAAADAWRSLPHVPDAIKQLSSAALAAMAIANEGKQRVPTLRNVAKRPGPAFPKNYTHNGYFKSLAGLVHFYNTRDTLPRCAGELTEQQALAAGCWPAPEVAENLNTVEVGNLGLTPMEEAALVAFLRTLSDDADR